MLTQGRKNMVSLIGSYHEDQLNMIPKGYNNNLVWNFGHVIVSQQILCYKLSGLEPVIDHELIEQYRRGTKPGKPLDQEQINELKTLAFTSVDNFREDYQNGIFKEFESYQSLYGVLLTSFEDAMVFNNAHEGLHLGYMMAMRKHLK